MPVTASCPVCNSCCCCTTCSRCMPEYLYLEITGVSGAGSASWAWLDGIVAVFRQARSSAPGCEVHPCNHYLFDGMLGAGDPDCMGVFPDFVDFQECNAANFTLGRVYPIGTPGDCPCDSSGTSTYGMDNDGQLYGTDAICSWPCFGASEANDDAAVAFVFGFSMEGGACQCSYWESFYDTTRCDTNPDSPFATITLTRAYCNIAGAACDSYASSRSARSCRLDRNPETGCPIIPPSQNHLLEWDGVVCGEDGGFVSHSFTATYATGSSVCSDGVVVITGVLYAP